MNSPLVKRRNEGGMLFFFIDPFFSNGKTGSANASKKLFLLIPQLYQPAIVSIGFYQLQLLHGKLFK
jgi:hypothetical protein